MAILHYDLMECPKKIRIKSEKLCLDHTFEPDASFYKYGLVNIGDAIKYQEDGIFDKVYIYLLDGQAWYYDQFNGDTKVVLDEGWYDVEEYADGEIKENTEYREHMDRIRKDENPTLEEKYKTWCHNKAKRFEDAENMTELAGIFAGRHGYKLAEVNNSPKRGHAILEKLGEDSRQMIGFYDIVDGILFERIITLSIDELTDVLDVCKCRQYSVFYRLGKEDIEYNISELSQDIGKTIKIIDGRHRVLNEQKVVPCSCLIIINAEMKEITFKSGEKEIIAIDELYKIVELTKFLLDLT